MTHITVLKIRQHRETPTTTVRQPNYVYRYAYARSTDSRANNSNGQDYLEIRENQQRLIFVHCDGVGQSFFGDIAASFLGNYLSNWLWHCDPTNQVENLRWRLEEYLRSLTKVATEQVNNYELPLHLPKIVRKSLESQRSYGSECMFVAGLIDVKLNRVFLARLGDIRVRLWESSIMEKTAFRDTFSDTARWSTRSGLVHRCNVFLSPLQGFSRIATYSDGLAKLDQWKGFMPRKQELDLLISQASNSPYNDDISFFEIMLPETLQGDSEKQKKHIPSSVDMEKEHSQTLHQQEAVAIHKEPELRFSRPLRVFLCHASQDKPNVRKLYKQLKSDSIDPWLDEEKLLPGQDWRIEIAKAVRSSDVILVCLSKKSISKEGFVQREIKLALDLATEKPEGTIFLIPLRIEECEVPEFFQHLQWVNYFEDNGIERLNYAFRVRAVSLGVANDEKNTA